MFFFKIFWVWCEDLSRIARLTLRRELTASVPLAAVLAVLGSAFCGFIGRKALNMSDAFLATLIACNMMGLLTAGSIAGFFHHRPKAKILAAILSIVSLVLFTISLIPKSVFITKLGTCLFLVQVFVAQLGIALVITLRTSIWRANYPARHRAKVVVLVNLCATFAGAGAIWIFTAAMDNFSLPFQAVYFVSGLMGIVAAFCFHRIRIQRERQTLQRLRVDAKNDSHPLLEGLSILKTDSWFRRFMAWQMLNGFSTLLIEGPVIIIIISDVFKSNWLQGGSALVAVPLVLTGLAGLAWAQIFDRVDIFTARFYGAIAWSLSRIVLMAGVLYGNMAIVILSRFLAGIAMGMGRLSWRLGHMEFAPPERDSMYMGAHVGLTGIRGVIAPFLGIYLYHLDFLAPHGIWLIYLTAIGQALAACGFLHMRKNTKKKETITMAIHRSEIPPGYKNSRQGRL